MTPKTDRAVLGAAIALQKAAILLRDIASAMPTQQLAKVPEDIAKRMFSPEYQTAFDALPLDVQEEAFKSVLDDPMILEARRIDAEGPREEH